jgi:hypothetical protein
LKLQVARYHFARAICKRNHRRMNFMRDVMELLRSKEQELAKVKRQVEALRTAAPLLEGSEDQSSTAKSPSKRDAGSST